MKYRVAWCALGWLLAPVGLGAAEITVIHGASVTGPLPPTDVVVLRGAELGGAVPVPVTAPEEPRIVYRTAPEAPVVELYVTVHGAHVYDDRVYRSRHFRHKRHHGRSGRKWGHLPSKSRLRWDR